VKVDGYLPDQMCINRGIVQGSGVGPVLYLCHYVAYSDIHPVSNLNLLFKYADNTALTVPAYSDVGLDQEFQHFEKWAVDNKMIISLIKTKEIVFRRPRLKHFLALAPVSGIEQVPCAKLLQGVASLQDLGFEVDIKLTMLLRLRLVAPRHVSQLLLMSIDAACFIHLTSIGLLMGQRLPLVLFPDFSPNLKFIENFQPRNNFHSESKDYSSPIGIH